MATLVRGQTFGASETVTNTKLHNLVDLGSITNIVNADCDDNMGLVDTKLADITTGNKVRGTSLGNLASIPSSAGYIPLNNIPIASFISYASLPNSALQPLTLASWVDGSAMRNIQSMPSLAGQLSYYSVVSSLASGSWPVFNGVDKFVGGIPIYFRLISNTTISGATNSGDISISSTKFYFIYVTISSISASNILALRFNNDTGGHYSYVYRGYDTNATAINLNENGAATAIQMADSRAVASNYTTNIRFNLYPQATSSTKYYFVEGRLNGFNSSVNYPSYVDFFGSWNNSADVTSFRIFATGGATFSGNILLYEIVQG